MNRREFLQVSTAAGGGLLLGVTVPGCASRQRREMQTVAEQTGAFRANMYLTITPDDRLLVDVEKSEMGQGVLTSHAMLMAEELEVDVDQIEASSADAAPEYRTNYGQQNTGNSASVAESYVPVRKAGAAARQMLVAAAAERWSVPLDECTADRGRVVHEPSDRELRYGELTEEAARQSIPNDPPIKDPEDFEIVGGDTRRVDAREKVDGTAEFGIDVDLPEMVSAYCIHPPVFGAEATALEAGEAASMRGVVDIFSFERGIAVIADKHWQAVRAAREVDVEWSETRGDDLDVESIAEAAGSAARESGEIQHDEGNVERALDREDVTVLEAEYASPFLSQAPMEPQNCTVDVREGEAEIWAPTQSPTAHQEMAARLLDLGRSEVTVHPTLLGGGFGRRSSPDFIAEAVMIGSRVDAPVQLVFSREDDFRGGYYRPINRNRAVGAIDEEGRPVAWRYHHVSPPVLEDWDPFVAAAMPNWVPKVTRRVAADSFYALSQSGSIPELIALEGAKPDYAIDNVRLEYTPIHTPVPVGHWRSVGNTYNAFVVESFIDEMAREAGRDPVDYRLELLDDDRSKRVLRRAVARADWEADRPPNAGRGVAVHEMFRTRVAEVVDARVIDGEIEVRRVVCVVDCGVAVNPDLVRAQMEGAIIYGLSAALREEVTLTDGRVDQGNFDDYEPMRMVECPAFDIHVVDSDHRPSGAGEPGLPPAAPALANAIADATGIRLRQMPMEDALAAKLNEEET